MPNPTLADLANFDAGRGIQFAQAGQRQRTLADLGQQAAAGDYAGAESTAWAGGQPDIAMTLSKMSRDRHMQIVEDAANGAISADDPTKWATFKSEFERTHPEFEVPPFQARQA